MLRPELSSLTTLLQGRVGRSSPGRFAPKLLTVLREGYGAAQLRADVIAGLTVAIIALPLATALAIASGASPDKGLITASPEEQSEDPSQRERLPDGVEVLRISGPFFFGVAGELLDALKRIGRSPRAIILRLEQVPLLDASGALALQEFLEQTHRGVIEVILCGLRPDLRTLIKREQSRDRPTSARFARNYETALALAAQKSPAVVASSDEEAH